MSKTIVLIVEDEEHIAQLLDTNLKMEGYDTILADNGASALEIIDERRVDFIVLDVMLPDTTGIDLCRKIKHDKKETPVLMLSALGQSKDRIKGLKSGADDYLAKPFELQELLLRMENLIQRFHPAEKNVSDIISLGKATINLINFQIEADGEMYTMTSKETQLLKYLVERKNEPVSRKEILEHVWGYEVYPHTRTIDNFVATYRKWIERNPSSPEIIKTVRGIGYMIVD